MMLDVTIVGFDELPPDVDKTILSNNGSGKDFASYLLVRHDGKLIFCESDAMEPEDCRFSRDLNWIKQMIETAYLLGHEDGRKHL